MLVSLTVLRRRRTRRTRKRRRRKRRRRKRSSRPTLQRRRNPKPPTEEVSWAEATSVANELHVEHALCDLI